MKALDSRDWLWQYAIPIAVLAATFPVTWLIGARVVGADDPDFFWAFVVVPVTAFLIGLIARPANIFVIPISTVIIFEAIAVAGEGLSHATGTLLNVVLLIGVPIAILTWAGKQLSPWVSEQFKDWRHDRPHAPTQ